MQGIFQCLKVCISGQRRDSKHATDVASDQVMLSFQRKKKKKRENIIGCVSDKSKTTYIFIQEQTRQQCDCFSAATDSLRYSVDASCISKASAVQQEQPSVYIGSIQLQNHSALGEFWLC